MKLRSIFQKPVDRSIEGVIKADDEASLRLELEEYVLTNEVEQRLEDFLEAYNAYKNANGVWISGFFGSGKSHLLKMLARILENQEIEGTPAVDYFLPKCENNKLLRGQLQKAVSIPSKSILFNIDQKADVISKDEFDALLSVFVKVFDEMRGYYGKQGHIAQFERDLDNRGLYEDFKNTYQEIAGIPWETGREQALLENQNIAVAYSRVTGNSESSANGIIDKYRQDYRVSIEDFAEDVKDYIDQKSPDFRLNFFVDEVGQYIAEHVKLMTNLQTIAESLATKCQGRAWIIVTAQEDMNSVIGDERQQTHDFTKIQARFKNRMKLTSQDVAEVIQKRLLAKNEHGQDPLSKLYHQQANNFKTLFDFTDGSKNYRNFQNQEHFINCYPFIPYQFPLFQSVIQNLSAHNAFEGKHSSVGERSMLGVFQQVAIQISEQEIGQLATFDLMFDGIHSTLKSNIQTSILQAGQHLDNKFAVRLLKTLFLVKYVKEFQSTVRNLCVLMLERFDQDLSELENNIQEALNLLEQQTYIQRNGEVYEYLTDEEKDVEQEIKNTEIEDSDVYEEFKTILFDNIIKKKKIRYGENGKDYPYARKLDDQLYGRDYELKIHIITPLNDNISNEETLKMQSAGRQDELMVVMAPDQRLVGDLLMYEKTEKYIQQNYSHTQKDSIKRILDSKNYQNRERHHELQQQVRRLISQSKLFINSSEVEISSQDAQTRIILGFQELIAQVYPNLRMLRDINYTEQDIANYLNYSQEGLFGSDVSNLDDAEGEVLASIQRNNNNGVRTTLKSLTETFEHKPYGWDYPAILCNVAKLCARNKVEVRRDGNLLEGEELEQSLRNSRSHSNVFLEPQIEFTASQVRNLKDFYADFFDQPPSSGEAKALGQETGRAFQQLKTELNELANQAAQYPFANRLNEALDQIKEVSKQPYTWYLKDLSQQEDELLDLKEEVIDPIRQFMNREQKGIYDEAYYYLHNQESNFDYINSDEPSQIKAILEDSECFQGNRMQQVKTLLESLRQQVSEQIETEITQAQEKINTLQNRLCNMDQFSALSSQQQQELIQPFERVKESIAQATLIAVIRERKQNFETNQYQELLSKMSDWAQPKPSPTSVKEAESKYNAASATEPTVISQQALEVNFDKAWLENENDLEQYLKAMREAMLKEINNGKRIQI